MLTRNSRLGRAFGTLWAAATVSALGDGVTQIAGPLLAVSITRSPVQVAGLMIAQQLSWVLFALPGGAIVDRVDRRRAVFAASVARVAALTALVAASVLGDAGLPLLYLSFFAIGCASLIFENAATAMLPALVARASLERANGRLQSAAALAKSLVAQPLGAWLFALAAWLPFLADAGGLMLVAALTSTLPALAGPATLAGPVGLAGSEGLAGPAGPARPARVTLRAAMGEGVRWLLGHRLLRTVAVAVAVSNVGLGGVFATFVLVARVRLGTGPVGYGLLLACSAVGGIAGGLIASRVIAAIGAGWVLRAEMVVEILSYLGLAVTHSAIAAGLLLALLGMHLVMYSTVSASLRQSLVPAGLLGRVHAAYRVASNGGTLAGAALGGLLSTWFGLTAPFAAGFAVMTLAAPFVWGGLGNRAIQAARDAADGDGEADGADATDRDAAGGEAADGEAADGEAAAGAAGRPACGPG